MSLAFCGRVQLPVCSVPPQVAEALRERAQRIYEKYGNVMLETAGMTKAGIERKATCRALFSKLLYLAGASAQKSAGRHVLQQA